MSIQRQTLVERLEAIALDDNPLATARVVVAARLWQQEKIVSEEFADLILNDTDPDGQDLDRQAERLIR